MDESTIDRLLRAHRIAIVGLSDDPTRASYQIAGYLISIGKEIFPVNPNILEVHNRRAYARLDHVPGPVELVNVFRRSESCPAIVQEAIDAGAKGIWLQSGIVSPAARHLADAANLPYIEDHCIMIEHRHRT